MTTKELDSKYIADSYARFESTGVAVMARGGDEESMLEKMLSDICAHLLYIVSENSDQEVEWRPSPQSQQGKKKPKKAQRKSTVHAVGTRVGRALGAPKVRYGNGGKGDGKREVSAHMRAGHWHHFWTGPHSDPDQRKLVLKWVAPTLVGFSEGGATDTVVHTAG